MSLLHTKHKCCLQWPNVQEHMIDKTQCSDMQDVLHAKMSGIQSKCQFTPSASKFIENSLHTKLLMCSVNNFVLVQLKNVS